MSKSSFVRLGDLVNELRPLQMVRAWKEACGPVFARHARFLGVRLENGQRVLKLDVPDATWRHEIVFEAEQLLELFNQALRSRGWPSQELPTSLSLAPLSGLPVKARYPKSRRNE
jgi:hypothetical protein